MYKKVYLLLFSLLFLISLACELSSGGASNGRKNPPSASKKAVELQVTDAREVEGARMLSVSPDGKWFLTEGDDEVCYGNADTLEQVDCVPFKAGLDTSGIAWSPDSTQAAFTENAYIYMIESDVWLLNLKSGDLKNLTNDGYEGSLLRAGEMAEERGGELYVDTSPAWSPDGRTLIFVRSLFSIQKGTYIYSIPVDGGKPVKLVTISQETPFYVYRTPRWTDDGKKFVYTVMTPKKGERDNGIWIVEKDGKNPKQLLEESQQWGVPVLLDVSTRGDKALIGYLQAMQQYRQDVTNQSFIQILDLKTQELTPLLEASGSQPEFYSPVDATFSPDGSKILYFYRQLEGNEWRLAVRDVGEINEEILLTPEWMVYYPASRISQALYWTESDYVFAITNPNGGWWIKIQGK
jgi:hypothetical protein